MTGHPSQGLKRTSSTLPSTVSSFVPSSVPSSLRSTAIHCAIDCIIQCAIDCRIDCRTDCRIDHTIDYWLPSIRRTVRATACPMRQALKGGNERSILKCDPLNGDLFRQANEVSFFVGAQSRSHSKCIRNAFEMHSNQEERVKFAWARGSLQTGLRPPICTLH